MFSSHACVRAEFDQRGGGGSWNALGCLCLGRQALHFSKGGRSQGEIHPKWADFCHPSLWQWSTLVSQAHLALCSTLGPLLGALEPGPGWGGPHIENPACVCLHLPASEHLAVPVQLAPAKMIIFTTFFLTRFRPCLRSILIGPNGQQPF